MTNEHQVTYYVKSDFKVDSREYLNKLEKQVEEELLVELRQSCFREKSYSKSLQPRMTTISLFYKFLI